MCRCFPEALNLNTQGLYQSVKSGADLSEAAFTVISTSNKLQQCMLDNGFDVKDNKAEVEAKDLSLGQGWIVLRAEEIDSATYADLAAAIAPCFTPAQCNPELIRGFFMNYLRKSKELMNDQLTGFLKEWLDIIGNMEKKGQEVVSAAENLTEKITHMPDKIKAIRDEVCVGEACLEQQVTSFIQKISSLNELVHVVENSKAAAITAVQVIPEMITQTRTAIEAAEADPDVNFLIELIKSGRLTKVDNIWNSFQAVQKLPEIVGHLKKSTTSIQRVVTQYNSYGHNAKAVIGEVLSLQWDTTAVGSGMTKIQQIIKTELEAPLGNLTNTIGQLGSVLDSFPVKDGRFALQTGVASYQRYSTVSMDVPCTRQGRKTFSAAGFKKTYSYPEFYLCPYGPKRIPWPNHHIPFIKVRT
ncbi:hypothetical protein TARUN_819 [Trichoderma arundinaceum]|uniref:Uncharacterized protein n=1 Tax=Trichoderma arundinaceum TaxID=490622 RepID=A0A395NZ39_TRIAR|nr:hypothetical protein TARUN_819 [Trichoderma arundinaceum]